MNAHTPGPWSAPRNGLDGAVYAENAPKGQLWRITDRVHGLSDEELAANAKLIAAAPELLAALEDIVRAEWTTVTLQGMTPQHRARLETARAVIAKAVQFP